MSEFSVLEVDILDEILNSSLKISINSLAEQFEIELVKLYPILDKFKQIKLLSYDKGIINVDKEMRKYCESQIAKFDDSFEPGIDYLQSLWNKVPIHILPSWYVIPRSSDHIFNSIIEKYLQTPKIYERYLSELNFDNPVMTGIMQDVFASSDFKVRAKDLREKYNLARDEFEEIILHLEFNLVCCLSYQKVDDVWEEVITPFYEWREYLLFLRDTELKKIADEKIKRRHEGDFGFIQDLLAVLKAALQTPLKMSGETISLEVLRAWLPNLSDSRYLHRIMVRLLQLNLLAESDGYLHPTEWSKEWIKKPLGELALIIYRLPLFDSPTTVDKDIREGEKSLKRAINKGWVYFDDFLKGVYTIIGSNEPIALKSKGKKWKYALPTYSENEIQLLRWIVFERLFEVGIVAIGTHEGRDCFCVTPFGVMAIGE